jgi:hypothetical protein
MKKKEKPSLGDFGIRHTVGADGTAPHLQTPAPQHTERTRAKGEKVGIVIRLDREDWHSIHDFANRQGISLQKLVVTSLAQYMLANGVKPIATK